MHHFSAKDGKFIEGPAPKLGPSTMAMVNAVKKAKVKGAPKVKVPMTKRIKEALGIEEGNDH